MGGSKVWVAAASLLWACGSKPEVNEASEEAYGGSEAREESAPDSLNVEGLRGTLSQQEIQNALEPRMPKFSRCVQKRSSSVEWVSGSMAFEFLVSTDGSVARVFPRESSMGDRDTERCMLDIAKGTRFPRPHGGEAEFGWSLEVPLDSDIREPVAWSAGEAGSVIGERTSELTSQCGSGPFALTAYVDVEGKVVAVGGSAPDEARAGQLDCVTQAVQEWVFPSPGSYAAKLQFSID
jgi:hypothetical protein